MYIFKNAWKSITRNKGRNILIMIIALVVAISACVSLSIREAAKTAKEKTMSNNSVTAQLTFDRTSMMKDMQSSDDGTFDRSKFDFHSLSGTSLTMDDYLSYTQYLSEDDSYYYTITTSLDASGDLIPYGQEAASEETDEGSEEAESTEDDQSEKQAIGRMKGMAAGDFTLVGFSNYEAMMSLFGEDGTYSITSGEMFAADDTSLNCVISNELAMYNDLSVGSIIGLANPDAEDEVYYATVCGIYSNSSSDAGNSQFSRSDPANNIYMSSASVNAICNASAGTGNEDPVSGETSFTYVLKSVEDYESFKSSVEKAGLPENYIVSSTDFAAYENSLAPLNTLSTMTGWFFLIVLVVGGIILVVINIFNLRERKYEVGVLAAIGMKKSKIISQFVCELFIITFAAILLGAVIGASVSVPVTNALLTQQVEKAESSDEQVNENFGFRNGHGMGKGGAMQSAAKSVEYVASVSSATDITVILKMILVGALLTILSSLAAMVTILRYEPLQILSNRS